MSIQLNPKDQKLVERVRLEIKEAYERAQMPAAVAKSISSFATKYRNKGRTAARKHPFTGVCEASGLFLRKEDANLDELEPEKGYAGKLRWVCPKANNSGKRSCGGC